MSSRMNIFKSQQITGWQTPQGIAQVVGRAEVSAFQAHVSSSTPTKSKNPLDLPPCKQKFVRNVCGRELQFMVQPCDLRLQMVGSVSSCQEKKKGDIPAKHYPR